MANDFTLPEGVRGHGSGSNGMLSLREGERLAQLAMNKIVLELGSWVGLSTITMARTAKHLYACDWHCGDAEMGGENSLKEFILNLKRYREQICTVNLLLGRFEDILPVLKAESFDLVYVDGAHDLVSVRRDTDFARTLVKADGVIVWHDGDRESVRSAVEETPLHIVRGPDRLLIGFDPTRYFP